MCCIFTCCGWVIDLIQRAWVFAMTCVIFTAVCCIMITSSMSGVALGYNYSLAEYIDLKETNVSVFMRRGVFDDDVSGSDMDWRRKANHPMPILDDDAAYKTAAPSEPVLPQMSGRRVDDTIIESDNNKRYEGSLMKLTAVPPYDSTKEYEITGDGDMNKAISSFKHGSLEQLKAIQSVINRRKMSANRDSNVKSSTYGYDERFLAHMPNFPNSPEQARRMAAGMTDGPGIDRPEVVALRYPPARTLLPQGINPARFDIPSGINSRFNWEVPKLKPEEFRKKFDTYEDPPQFLKPGTLDAGPIRPTTTSKPMEQKDLEYTTEPFIKPDIPDDKIGIVRPERRKMPGELVQPGMPNMPGMAGMPGIDDMPEMLELPGSLGQDRKDKAAEAKIPEMPDLSEHYRDDTDSKKIDPLVPITQKTSTIVNIDYYEEDSVKGLPVRRRRSINNEKLDKVTKVANEEPSAKYNSDNSTKLNVTSSVTNKITDFSILVSKLHYSKAKSNETTSAIKLEEKKQISTPLVIGQ